MNYFSKVERTTIGSEIEVVVLNKQHLCHKPRLGLHSVRLCSKCVDLNYCMHTTFLN